MRNSSSGANRGRLACFVFPLLIVLQLSFSLFCTNSAWLSLLTWVAIFHGKYVWDVLHHLSKASNPNGTEQYVGQQRGSVALLLATELTLPIVSLYFAVKEVGNTWSAFLIFWAILYNLGIFFNLYIHVGKKWYLYQSLDSLLWYIAAVLMYWFAYLLIRRFSFFSLPISYHLIVILGTLLTVLALVSFEFLVVMIAVTILLWIGLFTMLRRMVYLRRG